MVTELLCVEAIKENVFVSVGHGATDKYHFFSTCHGNVSLHGCIDIIPKCLYLPVVC